jgi:hypothetical protein
MIPVDLCFLGKRPMDLSEIIIAALVVLVGILVNALVTLVKTNSRPDTQQGRQNWRDRADTPNRRPIETDAKHPELYAAFRESAYRIGDELADGCGQWSSFYLARDCLERLRRHASRGVVNAAQQVCFVCQYMLINGYSDTQSVKLMQALKKYEEACGLVMPVAPPETTELRAIGNPRQAGEEAAPGSPRPARRREFKVLR